MKSRILPLILSCFLLAQISCEKQNLQEPDSSTDELTQISSDLLASYLISLGFRADMIEDMGDYFLVEGDIRFVKEDLENDIFRLSKTFQAATSYLVKYTDIQNIVIKIDGSIPTSGEDGQWRTAISDAKDEWNDISSNSVIHFVINNSASNPDITIKSGNPQGNAIGVAEFPTSSGKVGDEIIIDLNLLLLGQNPTPAQKKYNMAHELGHTIGFRHTNWVARNESTAPPIPHTPLTENTSVMNGGTANFSWTPAVHFSPGDKKGAQVLYPQSLGAPSISSITKTPLGFGSTYGIDIYFTTDSTTGSLEMWRPGKYGTWKVFQPKPLSTFPMVDVVVNFNGPYTYKLRADNVRADFPNGLFSNSVTVTF